MFTIPGRIPIQIYPLFVLVVTAISLINSDFQPLGALLWALVICFSLIVHELGHALTAMACGQRASIELVAFGGITRRYGKPLKHWQEFLIVFNGPLAGFLLCGLSYWLYYYLGGSSPVLLQDLLAISYLANLFWTIVNLLPVQPLDGGQLLRITLEGFFGLKGMKAAFFLSFIISLALSLALFIYHFLLAGSFFLLFTFEGYRAWKNSLPMTTQDDNRALQQFFKSAERDFHKGHYAYAQQKLNIVRKQAERGVLYTSATMLLAQIYHSQGHDSEAYSLLKPHKAKLTPETQLLLHELAYNQHLWQEAIDIGNQVYQYHPSYEVALRNAICHAQLGQVKPAVGWLQCAVKNGLPDLHEVLNKSDFNSIRQDPLFAVLAQK